MNTTRGARNHPWSVITWDKESPVVGGHMGRGITRGRWSHGTRNHPWSVITWDKKSPVVGDHMGQEITHGRWSHGARNNPWSVATWDEESPVVGDHMGREITRGQWSHYNTGSSSCELKKILQLISNNKVLTVHSEWLLGVLLKQSVLPVQYWWRIVRVGGCTGGCRLAW